MVLKKPTCGGAILITVKLAQTLIKCTAFLPLVGNEWLYVFGFATHILRFKAQKPIGKTDIYNVLVAGGFNPLPQLQSTKK